VFYVPANTVSLIGYIEDGFYRSKDPTNSIKVLKEKQTTNTNGHTLIRVSTTPGNPGNLLEFENPPGNPGNLLEFVWSSWKFLCKMSMIDFIAFQS